MLRSKNQGGTSGYGVPWTAAFNQSRSRKKFLSKGLKTVGHSCLEKPLENSGAGNFAKWFRTLGGLRGWTQIWVHSMWNLNFPLNGEASLSMMSTGISYAALSGKIRYKVGPLTVVNGVSYNSAYRGEITSVTPF